MVAKGKKTTEEAGATKITRITAKDTKTVEKSDRKAPAEEMTEKKTKNPLVLLGRYFKGSWQELKQVRWPTRRATWGLTLAVIIFTAVIAAVILLLDALFKYLFELMLG